jgi:hypothetical protein
MIADNRLAETSQWDDKLLAQQLKELSLLDLDFSLETSGFEMAEIDVRIESLTGDWTPEGDPADVFPRVPDQQPTSQAGDLWLLGRHRILCLARRALFCVTENSQDPSQPIRPIIGRTTAVVLVPKRPALRMGLFKNGARAGR